ncbi:MAG: hypothetical protein L3J78_01395, partial [Thermoplasmata archaeon]|nr:hypothetical protein [Thermoplasmata archaeon]
MLTGRTLAVLLVLGLLSGGAAWGVHAMLSPQSGGGRDYGLDTDGNGKFDWLVVEAQVALPKAGTWDIYADLSASTAPSTGSCGSVRLSPPMMTPAAGVSYPIAWAYERYFFPAGTQTVQMAFSGPDIVRAGVDGPYLVHARLSLGGFPMPLEGVRAPVPDLGDGSIEWNYATNAYANAEFEPPVRPAYFTGGHTDTAVDVNGDGLADYLEVRADVKVNVEGHYNLNGYLLKGSGTDVVRFVASAYRDFNLTTADAQVFLRFRGDQIRAAAVDGPWNFTLTLYSFPGGPIVVGTQPPASGIVRPQPAYYPEMLCGTTAAYRASDFDAAAELLRYTGRFDEGTPDWNHDGTYDALIVRAEVDVFVGSSFTLSGSLRPATGSTEVARTAGQTWLRDGTQWVDFKFPGPEIRSSGIDGPYVATLSMTPGPQGIDP